ncbi:50S ribosome-binding GTPase [Vagococcus sp. BWB3-3]|uniref:50S ribosome-binding GTPase n=1 Tax=Vagococcus allomyrinae TaxID=2794353 RepID=A0A940SW66_9ENTE|nr:GTPase [Vagococcus allomyrinae]MBP1042659.1 50S ribosome-binding GTPase [Vagococcus allomyrinae]
MSKNNDTFYDDLLQKINMEESKLKSVNFIIAGKSGVGKSTLINQTFREELAETGIGKPVTKQIELIEKIGVPVRLYDTVGLELDKKMQKKSLKDIKELVKASRKKEDGNEAIHCMWYCVAGNGDRFEDTERDFIEDVAKLGIPVILVLTKSYSKSSALKFKQVIQEMTLTVKDIVILCAEGTAEQEAYGLDDLIVATSNVLPDSIQTSFMNAQKVSRDLKDKQARRVIDGVVLTTFGQGFIPIPFSDAPILIASQTGMLAKITSVYGIKIEKKGIETIAGGIIGITGTTVGGKSIVSSIFKLFPGLGTIAGGMVSGSTAAILTKLLGEAYIQLINLIIDEKIKLSELNESEMKELLLGLLKGASSSVLKK